MLHHPDFRGRFAADLKKELPRIPLAPDFQAFASIGAKLAQLHLNYENAAEYPLQLLMKGAPILDPSILTAQDYRVEKMRWDKNSQTRIIYNERLSLDGIPKDALRYIVNGRSALGWVIERYKEHKDKDSQIENNPNLWNPNEPDFIIRHLRRVCYVSVETTKLTTDLTKLTIL